MPSRVSDKLTAVAAEIHAQGFANLTRLTVLKKWFERPGRLSAFGLWVAKRSADSKDRTKASAPLLGEARTLLENAATRQVWPPTLDRSAAESLRDRARDFQNEFKRHQWGAIRIIHSWPLFLVEQGLALHLHHSPLPPAGYKLAADFCQHYDSRYGSGLSGPSRDRILEIVGFVAEVEANEEAEGR